MFSRCIAIVSITQKKEGENDPVQVFLPAIEYRLYKIRDVIPI